MLLTKSWLEVIEKGRYKGRAKEAEKMTKGLIKISYHCSQINMSVPVQNLIALATTS